MEKFLKPTKLIDCDNALIIQTTKKIIKDCKTEREMAMKIHDFVRDEIKFGICSEFYNMKASQVLERKVGFCNTKATLFCAMLRNAKIPCRIHFYNINKKILTDFINPQGDYVKIRN